MTTLIPYRNYFREQFGAVRYPRDRRPIAGPGAAFDELITPDNPYGFGGDRPDLNGWATWAARLRNVVNRGFHRIMFWAPSGLAYNHRHLNYPFEFMTQMNNVPAMASSLNELRSIPSDQLSMGYWWGHSGHVSFGWDTDTGATLNPYNPDHVSRAFAELDMARSLGATEIGLDAAMEIPGWDLYIWLGMMEDHAPEMRFVTEMSGSDLHMTLAPTFVWFHDLTGPNLLADFVTPGHEFWSAMRFDIIIGGTDWWAPFRRQQRLDMLADNVSWGMIGLPYADDPLDHEYLATDSWMQTLPPALRPCVP